MQILSLKEETSSCLVQEGRGGTIAASLFSGDFQCLDPTLFSCLIPRMKLLLALIFVLGTHQGSYL